MQTKGAGLAELKRFGKMLLLFYYLSNYEFWKASGGKTPGHIE